MLTLYFDNKVNWKNQFFSITCPCYTTKVWEVFQFFFLVVKIMLTHLCLEFFEDWHQTDLKKFDLKKKMISKYQEKKVLIFVYLFIHLFIYSPFFAGGGQVGGVGWKEAKGFDIGFFEGRKKLFKEGQTKRNSTYMWKRPQLLKGWTTLSNG